MRDSSHPLKPETYRARTLDQKIEYLLDIYTLLDLRGVRGSGKSWCALAHAKSVISAGDKTIAIPLIQMDARIALTGPRPHAVDEWSAFPDLSQKALKASNDPGSFMLLTSVEPLRTREDHQRAGHPKTARLRMRTLTLAERGFSDGAISLAELVASSGTWPALPGQGGRADADEDEQSCALGDMALLASEGGWAVSFGRSHADAQLIAVNHVNSLIAGEVRARGRKESVARVILGALEHECGSDTSYAALCTHANAAGLAFPSRNTLGSYTRTFEQLYLVEQLPGWKAPIRSASRVKTKPRLVVADPSIGIAAAGLSAEGVRSSDAWLQAAFRALSLHDVLAYAEALPEELGASASYYADADGLSADVVLLFRDGRWAPITCATSAEGVYVAIKQLGRLAKKVTAGGSGIGEPKFRLVVTPGGHPWRDARTGTVVVPLTNLGA